MSRTLDTRCEACDACDGEGIVYGLDGEVVTCGGCGGSRWVRCGLSGCAECSRLATHEAIA